MFSMYSETGRILKVLNGYKYRYRYNGPSGRNWVCAAVDRGCNATITTDEDGEILLKAVENHTHPPCKILDRQIISNSAKVNVRKQISIETDEAITNEITSLPEDFKRKLDRSDLARIRRNVSYAIRRAFHQSRKGFPDASCTDAQFDARNSSSSLDKMEETSLLKDATAPDECRTGKDLGAREIINLDSGSDSENSMDYDIIPEIKMEHNQIKVDRWRPDGSDEPLKATKTEPQNSDTCNQRLTTGRVRISDVTTCLNGSVPHSSTLNLDPVSINAVVEEPSCATNTQTDSYTSHSTGSDLTILEGSVISLREDKSIIPMSSSFPNHNNGNQNLVVNEPLTDSRISATSVYSDSTNTAIEPLPYPSEQTLPKSKSLLEMNEFEAFGQYLGVQLINLPLDLALELQKNIENLLAMSRKKNNPNKTSFAQCEGELINIEDDDISISE